MLKYYFFLKVLSYNKHELKKRFMCVRACTQTSLRQLSRSIPIYSRVRACSQPYIVRIIYHGIPLNPYQTLNSAYDRFIFANALSAQDVIQLNESHAKSVGVSFAFALQTTNINESKRLRCNFTLRLHHVDFSENTKPIIVINFEK